MLKIRLGITPVVEVKIPPPCAVRELIPPIGADRVGGSRYWYAGYAEEFGKGTEDKVAVGANIDSAKGLIIQLIREREGNGRLAVVAVVAGIGRPRVYGAGTGRKLVKCASAGCRCSSRRGCRCHCRSGCRCWGIGSCRRRCWGIRGCRRRCWGIRGCRRCRRSWGWSRCRCHTPALEFQADVELEV